MALKDVILATLSFKIRAPCQPGAGKRRKEKDSKRAGGCQGRGAQPELTLGMWGVQVSAVLEPQFQIEQNIGLRNSGE